MTPDTVEREEWLADLIETAMDNAMDVDVGTHELSRVAARTAGIAAPAVRVKPLEWIEPHSGNNYCTVAKTGFGEYYVDVCGGRHQAWMECYERPYERDLGGPCGDMHTAKAVAQADYERRISAALEPAPAQSVQEAASVLLREFPHGGWPSECYNAMIDFKDSPDEAMSAALRALTEDQT